MNNKQEHVESAPVNEQLLAAAPAHQAERQEQGDPRMWTVRAWSAESSIPGIPAMFHRAHAAMNEGSPSTVS